MEHVEALSPLRAQSLRENVAELLVEKILSGTFQPGDRLNESALSRQLQVSRAPIREALQQLQEQGLVVNQPRRGMFVVRLDENDVRKINAMRVVLEAEALVLCREHMTPAVLQRIRDLLERMESEELTALEATRRDLTFHRTIWASTSNEYLERALTSITSSLFAYALVRKAPHEHLRMILDSHRPLFDFLLGTGDFLEARQVMHRHLNLRW
jgi:DNA-binding GntR family transcriptional regulator